jgi:hypothetical protein
MFDSLFSSKCTALIGSNGRALTGDALAAAEKALSNARQNKMIIWSDRDGYVHFKRRRFFASVKPLLDETGAPVRFCSHQVKCGANFCSKCGSPAPGSWWRCGGCGKHIGIESKSCPHCGKAQQPAMRLDIADGSWQKSENVFAERFELKDIMPLIPKGLTIQSNQMGLLLSGGVLSKVLAPGFYDAAHLLPDGENALADQSLVMVDGSEFILPVCVDALKSAEDIDCELHAAVVLQFDPDHAAGFVKNMLGSNLYLNNEEITSALAYDAIAHFILQNIDGSTREFCNSKNAEAIFKDPASKQALEDHLAAALARNLSVIGIKFNRLNEVEFESAAFEKFRDMSGAISSKKQEIELKQQADRMADEAVRKEAVNEYEMDDYMKQLAHEDSIKDELRRQEMSQVKASLSQKLEKAALAHENDLDDLQQERQLDRDRTDAEFEQELLDLQHEREVLRRSKDRLSELEAKKIDSQIRNIDLEIEKSKTAAEQESAEKWLEIKMKKQAFNQTQKIDLINSLAGADLQAMLMAEDDPEKRQDLLRLYEQRAQAAMTPEFLLAAAAARGNTAAAEAMAKLSQEKQEMIERAKTEHKELFDEMLKMNERMFNKTVENMARNAAGNGSAAPTNININ